MRRRKRFTPLLLIVVVVALAGCASTAARGTKYTAFKTATAALVQNAQTNYGGVESLWDGLTAQCLALPGNEASYRHLLSGTGIPCGKDEKGKVRRFEDPRPLLQARLEALEALARYGSLLNTLATTDYAAGTNTSTATLCASLESLQNALTPLVAEAANLQNATTLLGSAARAAGGLYVEGERKKALRTLLAGSQGGIQTLAEKLLLDNGYVATLARSYMEFSVGQADKTRPADYEKRVAYDAKVLQQYKNGLALAGAITSKDKAVQALPEAHAELLESLDKPGTPLQRLEAFVAAAEQALALAQQLENI